MNNKHELAVNEIPQTIFSIPHYQRGYRWTDKEVEALLNDLLTFSESDTQDESYCLQPLVLPFLHEVEISPNEQSIERALKLALRRLPENERLSFFAHAITSPLPHAAKAALWRVIRYSHFWWNVDALLQEDVMENPTVQRAFADAVAMRRWTVMHRRTGWEDAACTFTPYARERESLDVDDVRWTKGRVLASLLMVWEDARLADYIPLRFADAVADFSDSRGNGILWYLTYREDQNAPGGYACPRTAETLISLGADPYRENELGLCWNDVARHFVRKMC